MSGLVLPFRRIIPIAAGGSGAVSARAAMTAMSGVYILGQSGVEIPLTGTVAETALATIPVPAGAMGPNGRLRITALWNYTNSANNKTLRVRFGGIGGTIYHSTVLTTTANFRAIIDIANRNATNSQVGAPNGLNSVGSTTGALVTGAIDTTLAQDIVITGTLASAGEAINLESYLVELFAAAGT